MSASACTYLVPLDDVHSHGLDCETACDLCSWARKAALEKPGWAGPPRIEAIARALSGRIVEAQEALARMLAIDPDVRLNNPRFASIYQRAEDRALFIEGLRRAGLPE